MDILNSYLTSFQGEAKVLLTSILLILCFVRLKQIYLFIMNIINLRLHIRNLKLGILSKRDLHNYSPYEFEHWCAEFLELKGFYDVTVTPNVSDGVKDIVGKNGTLDYFIECKRFNFKRTAKHKIDLEICRKLVGAMEGENIRNGIIITTGYADKEALKYVSSLPKAYIVEIIDGDELIHEYANIGNLNPLLNSN